MSGGVGSPAWLWHEGCEEGRGDSGWRKATARQHTVWHIQFRASNHLDSCLWDTWKALQEWKEVARTRKAQRHPKIPMWSQRAKPWAWLWSRGPQLGLHSSAATSIF